MTITDIITEARGLVDATETSYPCAATTDLLFIRINNAYEEIIGDLIALDKNWKFDDSNHTDLPLGVSTLVAGQQDYAFDVSLLGIERVEVEDNEGNWYKLSLLDEKSVGQALSEYKSTNGLPEEYAIRGNSLFLYPAPASANVTLVGGLKVYFRRTASVFTTAEVTAGTKVPGFASPYHSILSYKSALPYARTYKPERVASMEREIDRLHSGLIALYSNQNKDKESKMTPFVEDNR
jgi:hypothetical protein